MSQCLLARGGGEEKPRLGMMKDLLGPARCSPESALHITPESDEVMKSDGEKYPKAKMFRLNRKRVCVIIQMDLMQGRKQFSFKMTRKRGKWKPWNGTAILFFGEVTFFNHDNTQQAVVKMT